MHQKKIKTNPCIVCLGLLQEFSFNDIMNHPDLTKVQEYDSETFTCSISMPACIMLREKSMRIKLEEKFPKYFTDGDYTCTQNKKNLLIFCFIIEKEDLPLNKAWKMVVKDKLASHIHKKFENSDICDFFINITMNYENNLEVHNFSLIISYLLIYIFFLRSCLF